MPVAFHLSLSAIHACQWYSRPLQYTTPQIGSLGSGICRHCGQVETTAVFPRFKLDARSRCGVFPPQQVRTYMDASWQQLPRKVRELGLQEVLSSFVCALECLLSVDIETDTLCRFELRMQSAARSIYLPQKNCAFGTLPDIMHNEYRRETRLKRANHCNWLFH